MNQTSFRHGKKGERNGECTEKGEKWRKSREWWCVKKKCENAVQVEAPVFLTNPLWISIHSEWSYFQLFSSI